MYWDKAESTVIGMMAALRWWWRFLDDFEKTMPDGHKFSSCKHWDGIHYAFYRVGHIKGARFCIENIAQIFFKILNVARKEFGLPFWWVSIPTPAAQRELLTTNDVRRLYHFFKRQGRESRNRMELAYQMLSRSTEGINSSSDSLSGSQNEIVKEMRIVHGLQDPTPYKKEVISLFVLFMLQTGWNPSIMEIMNDAIAHPELAPTHSAPHFAISSFGL